MNLISPRQIARFHKNGYLVVENFNAPDLVESAKARFKPLFHGEFETGVQPDEWNWRAGTSPEDHTRQICNGWKSDRAIARLVLNRKVGQACSRLMGWPGTRINQDNVIWKPPGAQPLGFHQDDAYQDWIDPPSLVSCWMALDDTREEGGTIEYVRNSNHWPVEPKKFTFHAPQEYREGLRFSMKRMGIADCKIDRLCLKAGDVVFHHGRTWHGSGANSTCKPRRTVVAHCMSSQARFHPVRTSPIYSRYRQYGSTEMEESYFPVIYSETRYRSGFLEELLCPAPPAHREEKIPPGDGRGDDVSDCPVHRDTADSETTP